MPTFRFYAAREDAAVLLTFMFGELGCRVFEAYSRYGEALKELGSTDEVLEAFPAAGPSRRFVNISLWSPALGPKPTFRRIALAPSPVSGDTYWHMIDGWGLVNLQFGLVSEGTLRPSDLKYSSEARARRWEETLASSLGPVDAWDWRAVEMLARRLHYHLGRRLAVRKHGARPVLAGAAALAASGVTLGAA